jgi:ribosomal protein L9
MAEKINAIALKISAKVGAGDKLFGSVSNLLTESISLYKVVLLSV